LSAASLPAGCPLNIIEREPEIVGTGLPSLLVLNSGNIINFDDVFAVPKLLSSFQSGGPSLALIVGLLECRRNFPTETLWRGLSMQNHSFIRLSTLLGVVTLAPLAAHATPATLSVPAATYAYDMVVNGGPNGVTLQAGTGGNPLYWTYGTAQPSGLANGFGSASVQFDSGALYNGAPVPSASSAAGNSSFVSISEAYITYYFDVIAPGNSVVTNVPVIATGTSTLSATGMGGDSSSQADIFGQTESTVNFECNNGILVISGCGNNSYRISTGVAAFPLAQFMNGTTPVASSGSIEILAYSSAGPTPYAGSGTAYIDPYIEIDPTFLAANPGYVLEVSDGLANQAPTVSAVPEPSSFTLAGVLLLGIIGLQRRRRR